MHDRECKIRGKTKTDESRDAIRCAPALCSPALLCLVNADLISILGISFVQNRSSSSSIRISMEDPANDAQIENDWSLHGDRIKHLSNHKNDTSAAMAARLLEGWAMLAEYCPQCFTPLLRNREKRIYCVSCSQWVVSEAEVAAQVKLNSSGALQAHPETSKINGADIGTNNHQTNMSISNSVQLGHASEKKSCESNGRQSHGVMGPAKAESSTSVRSIPTSVSKTIPCAERNDGGKLSSEDYGLLTSLEMPPHPALVLSQAFASIMKKIENLSHLVTATDDLESINQLLGTIEHCIQVADKITVFSSKVGVNS